MTLSERVDAANQKVVDIFTKARPVWKDVAPAGKVVPGMKPNTILHPGPPLAPDLLPLPIRTAISGAAVHEGLAANTEEAWNMVRSGEIEIGPAQDHDCSCAASMVTSASMPVFVCEDPVFGGTGTCTIHPGSSPRVLRWGLYGDDVERNLRWLRDEFGPCLGEAVRASGGIDLVEILARTAGMGDENHNRQPASSMALALKLIPFLLKSGLPARDASICELAANERFFLQVLMAGIGGITRKAKEVKDSTVMVGMGGNGVEFGIQVAATGDRWYTTQAPVIRGTFLDPRTTYDDVLGYMGDSCITEVYGLGGMSSVAGPSYSRLIGTSFADAKERTEKARAVSLAEHAFAAIPWDSYKGAPVCVDIRKVVGLGVLPVSHGGSGLKTGGQAGAGIADLPMECFKNALRGVSAEIMKG